MTAIAVWAPTARGAAALAREVSQCGVAAHAVADLAEASRYLSAAAGGAVLVADVGSLADPGGAELAFVDAVGSALGDDARRRLLVVARARRLDELGELFLSRRVHHWIAAAVADDLPRAIAERAALLAEPGRQPRLDRVAVFTLAADARPSDPRAAAAPVVERARRLATGASATARLAAVVEELLANALRAAPAGAIEVELSTAGPSVGIRVRDPAGTLDADAVMRALARGHAGGGASPSGGGGLGLFYVLGLSTHLSFTLAPGRSTDVFALVSPRTCASFARSLDVFMDASPPATGS